MNLGLGSELQRREYCSWPLGSYLGANRNHRSLKHLQAQACVHAIGETLTTDQRGEPRPETGGTMCDVGAFERQPGDQ